MRRCALCARPRRYPDRYPTRMRRLLPRPQPTVGHVSGALAPRQAGVERLLPARDGAARFQPRDLRLSVLLLGTRLPRWNWFLQLFRGTCCKIPCGEGTLRVPRERGLPPPPRTRVLQIVRALTTDTSEASRFDTLRCSLAATLEATSSESSACSFAGKSSRILSRPRYR